MMVAPLALWDLIVKSAPLIGDVAHNPEGNQKLPRRTETDRNDIFARTWGIL
jgi:hypothetical protein